MTLLSPVREIDTDLFIIGAGMAGMSAAVFAANRNIKTVLAGAAGGFEYASGLMDLWGLSLTQNNKITQKPWDMLAHLKAQQPNHPFCKLKTTRISRAFNEITDTLRQKGLTYTGHKKLNHGVITPFGTIHPTFRLPLGLKANADVFKRKPACLILDFRGLREFSALFFCEMLKNKWLVTPACIEFPGSQARAEVFTPFLARAMETKQIQDQFIKSVKPLLKGKSALGVPAMLGVQSSEAIRQYLEKRLGVTIFEIPTSPVSVPGSRLKETLYQALEDTSVTRIYNQRVTQVVTASDNGFECLVGTGRMQQTLVKSKAVLLAGGRFLGKGLVTEKYRIKEPLFDLPLSQPQHRQDWHAKNYFDLKGHLINRAGIEVDDCFRPVDPEKGVVYKNLYASGSILAHQDWIRSKSGSGIAIATGYAAVESCFQVSGVND